MRADQHQLHRAVSRRGPAGGDLRHRAADRRRRPRARPGPRSSSGGRTSSRPRRCRTRTPLGVTYDCGEFEKSMDDALEARRRRRLRRAARGVARAGAGCAGSAVVNAIEQAAAPAARVRGDPLRRRAAAPPCSWARKNQGQGHETTFKQILHERLGLDPDDVRYIDGDTDRVAFGMGTMGSRSTVIGGHRAVDGRRQGDRQGQEDRGAAAGGGRGGHRVRRRPVRGGRARTGPSRSRRWRAPPSSRRSCRPGSSRGSTRRAPSSPQAGHVAQRLPRLRGRDRPRHRRRRARRAT